MVKKVDRKRILALLILILIMIVSAIIYWKYLTPSVKVLRVSTTTSLYATGLLDFLADEFKKMRPNVVIQFIAVGSGAALKLAEKGDVDMVFVHAPNLEKEYIEEGILINGTIFAYNNFIIVGSVNDPANISNCDPVEAMRRIYETGEAGKALFVSRGDNSGTHQRELLLWRLAELNATGKSWYIETGSGMSETLLVANEKDAYTLTDTGTYLKLKRENKLPNLETLVDEGFVLLNIYSAYIVNPDVHPHVKYDLAMDFLLFVISNEGQELIGSYGVEEFGVPLFYPAKGKENDLYSAWLWFANQP